LSALEKGRTVGLSGAAQIIRAHLLASLSRDTQGPMVIVCQDDTAARKLQSELQSFLGKEIPLLPTRDWTFYCATGVSRQWEHKRIELLHSLATGHCPLLIASLRALTMRTMPKDKLLSCTLVLEQFTSMAPEKLVSHLLRCGYSRSDLVEGVGQFALRGGILDLFSPGADRPVRIDFYGDEIDIMGLFDPLTQRRIDNVDSYRVLPVAETVAHLHSGGICGLTEDLHALESRIRKRKNPHEQLLRTLAEDVEALEQEAYFAASDRYISLIYPEYACAADYLPKKTLVCLCDHGNLKKAAEIDQQEEGLILDNLLSGGLLCGELCEYSRSWEDFCEGLSSHRILYLDAFLSSSYPEGLKPKELLSFTAKQLPGFSGNADVAATDLEFYSSHGYGTIVLCGSKRRGELLQEQLKERGIHTSLALPLVQLPKPGQILLAEGSLTFGMEYPQAKLAVLAEGQLNSQPNKKSLKRNQKRSNRQKLETFADLNPGDLVVHDEYGIGRFLCMEAVTQDGVTKDYIKIAYLADGMLYVPATRLDLIAKYIGGGEDGAVKLNRLGGSQWEKTKSRARSSAKDMAQQLIRLYAERKRLPGFAFSPDDAMQREFEDNFQYVETEDQLRCILEIKEDMGSPTPMDRLLCGDVGFGKTEVALRAAMKAIADSKQVAILVPTTVLAQQHYTTAVARFYGFPVNIGVLSRFCTPARVKQTLADLRAGNLDLIVGTHKLLQKDVEFKDLGLLIVDEEQRFGVTHKEKLKELSKGIDVLTLSATPIPRTLNMALTGVRDLSTLEEPPQDRFPVQTFVLEHNEAVIHDAIRRELERGGQVYYMHNRVQSIDRVAAELKRAFPHVNVGVAHGKLGEAELSDTMQGLMDGDISILVCTTIIETGIDNPNVNTLIIEDADKLGLAQLHQIRGRVGRSNRHAFAYMTYRRGKILSEIAEKRLNAIRDFAEFGSGFKIAMRDLEIRGAGNLLGAEQSGHMVSVGYDMYLRLLEEAVLEEKGEAPKEQRNCTADLTVEACIPKYYVPTVEQRMDLYRRMAAIRNPRDAEELLDEIVDRFGEPEKSVTNLIDIALLRSQAAALGITEIRQFAGALHLRVEEPEIIDRVDDTEKLPYFRKRLTLYTKEEKLFMKLLLPKDTKPLKEAQHLINALGKTESC
ncbi:MAG: transcription-repair coupling factor, partial [Oscillospiraceae bacterium]|nr:transcription-repair coupling factor [Oscillospiraceae bacterium]